MGVLWEAAPPVSSRKELDLHTLTALSTAQYGTVLYGLGVVTSDITQATSYWGDVKGC